MRSDPRMRDLMRPQRGLTLALTLCLFREPFDERSARKVQCGGQPAQAFSERSARIFHGSGLCSASHASFAAAGAQDELVFTAREDQQHSRLP